MNMTINDKDFERLICYGIWLLEMQLIGPDIALIREWVANALAEQYISQGQSRQAEKQRREYIFGKETKEGAWRYELRDFFGRRRRFKYQEDRH